jgi:energy-coupling factor transport system permease protein
MHPVIRIATFLIVAVFLSTNNVENLITAAILLLLLFFTYPSSASIKQAVKIIFRLRWLFLSVLVIYGWFSTGDLLFPDWHTLSPYKQGIVHGLIRVAALMMLILSLTQLVFQLSRNDLLGSISWYCYPVKWIGIPEQRVIARLILTINAVQELEKKWKKNKQLEVDNHSKLQNLYQRVLQLFDDVIATAEHTETRTISVSVLTSPDWYQWLIPLTLFLIFWLI